MKKLLCIALCLFFLTGCKDNTLTIPYSQQEVVLKGNAENPIYLESNTFYEEALKNKIVDIVNTLTYSNKKSIAKRVGNASQVSVLVDNKEIIVYDNGDLILENNSYHASNGEQVYKELQAMLQDAKYDAYSTISKIDNEQYIIDTNVSFENQSTLGTYDSYKINLPISYPLESVEIAQDVLQAHQSVEKQLVYPNQKSSLITVRYDGEPRTVQEEVENANITVTYSKDNKVAIKKSISLVQRCTLVIK